jgi:hypothetical protein
MHLTSDAVQSVRAVRIQYSISTPYGARFGCNYCNANILGDIFSLLHAFFGMRAARIIFFMMLGDCMRGRGRSPDQRVEKGALFSCARHLILILCFFFPSHPLLLVPVALDQWDEQQEGLVQRTVLCSAFSACRLFRMSPIRHHIAVLLNLSYERSDPTSTV